MKTLVFYVLCIVDCLSRSHKPYQHAKGLFDARLRSFQQFIPMNGSTAHLPAVNLARGLMHLIQGSSQQEKCMTSHSMGRIPSSHFITLLLLIYFVIGDNGDILPVEKTLMYNRVSRDGKNH